MAALAFDNYSIVKQQEVKSTCWDKKMNRVCVVGDIIDIVPRKKS